jgi:hypothetical protein
MGLEFLGYKVCTFKILITITMNLQAKLTFENSVGKFFGGQRKGGSKIEGTQ